MSRFIIEDSFSNSEEEEPSEQSLNLNYIVPQTQTSFQNKYQYSGRFYFKELPYLTQFNCRLKLNSRWRPLDSFPDDAFFNEPNDLSLYYESNMLTKEYFPAPASSTEEEIFRVENLLSMSIKPTSEEKKLVNSFTQTSFEERDIDSGWDIPCNRFNPRLLQHSKSRKREDILEKTVNSTSTANTTKKLV